MTRIHTEVLEYPPESKIKILALRCDKATRQTYVDGKFFIRTGNSTTELPAEKAMEYIRDRFPD